MQSRVLRSGAIDGGGGEDYNEKTQTPGTPAAGLLLAKKPAGVVLGGVFGVTLMLWICIQFYMFPPNFMSTSYFIFGLIQAATGYMAWVFQKQEAFRADREDYPRIGTDPRRLVVFFSRMGYVRKKAYEEAERTGAAVYEIRAAEHPVPGGCV